MKWLVSGALTLLCSSVVFALPITGVANISSGDAVASPSVIDGGLTYTVMGGTRVLYSYEGDIASTEPDSGAGDVGLPTVFEQIAVQIDPILTALDIFNPSSGYIGVGVLDGIYGVIFENSNRTGEFAVSFETNTLPVLGRFLALGTTGNGTPFTFTADTVYVPGSQPIGRPVPEPASLALALVGLVGIGAHRKRQKT